MSRSQFGPFLTSTEWDPVWNALILRDAIIDIGTDNEQSSVEEGDSEWPSPSIRMLLIAKLELRGKSSE